jgi:transcriptional regulator with XRE-family HTH domain
MANADQLVGALKKVLKTRGWTYADIARGLDLSEASIKRLFSEQTFTLQRLDEVCRLLDMDLYELARLARGESETLRQMTVAQEALLAADRKLLAVLYLLRNNRDLNEIVAEYQISEPECIRLLVKLDRAGLIELLPENRVRLRVSRQVRHRPNGPLRQRLGEEMVNDFLSVRFDEHGGHFRFEVGELSAASAAMLSRKLDRLAAEFYELSELDMHLPPRQRALYGFALGMRPWSGAAELAGLKRRTAAPGKAR